MVRRLPFKRGFNNVFRIEYQEVNVDDLAVLFAAGDTVTPEALAEKGLIKKVDQPVVILGRGELTIKLDGQGASFLQERPGTDRKSGWLSRNDRTAADRSRSPPSRSCAKSRSPSSREQRDS